MADFAEVDGRAEHPGAFDGYDRAPGAFAVMLGWVGALMSAALIVGLGVWGYQLAVRDVTGVPVVRALEGPMRVAPDNPGGLQAAHQGLSVNSVAAEGGAAAPPDRLVLAPAPLDLNEDDLPRPELGGTPLTVESGTIAETTLDTAPPAASEADMLALADTLAEGAPPLDVAPEEELAAAPDTAPEIIPASVPGVSRSPLPQPRPLNRDATAVAIATEVALAVARIPSASEVDPGQIPAGTRLVQFGAFDTPDLARAAWDTLETRFGDFLDGKDRIVQEAVSGGQTFYRLRAMGFADLSDARRFCAALVAERQACIPVVVR